MAGIIVRNLGETNDYYDFVNQILVFMYLVVKGPTSTRSSCHFESDIVMCYTCNSPASHGLYITYSVRYCMHAADYFYPPPPQPAPPQPVAPQSTAPQPAGDVLSSNCFVGEIIVQIFTTRYNYCCDL